MSADIRNAAIEEVAVRLDYEEMRVSAAIARSMIAGAGDPEPTQCPKCKAPCTTSIAMRGGEHGWGTSDLERTRYHYAAPQQPAEAGYADAFYELGALMGLSAQPLPPATVWKEQMLPRLQRALALDNFFKPD